MKQVTYRTTDSAYIQEQVTVKNNDSSLLSRGDLEVSGNIWWVSTSIVRFNVP